MEEKLNQAHVEVQQLKASVKNYEGMIDNYKSQVGLSGAKPARAAPPSRLGWRFTIRPLLGRCFSPKLGSAQDGPTLCWSPGDEDQTGG